MQGDMRYYRGAGHHVAKKEKAGVCRLCRLWHNYVMRGVRVEKMVHWEKGSAHERVQVCPDECKYMGGDEN